MSLRPRACDFRRLRFSRNASFSRSRLAPFFGRPPALSVSSFIVDPFECIAPQRTSYRVWLADLAIADPWGAPQMAAPGRRPRQIQRSGQNDRIRGHDPPDQDAIDASRGNWEPDRPATHPDEGGRRPAALISVVFGRPAGRWRACARGGLVARIGPPVAAFWADSLKSGACCRSSVVEHSIGNGEVDSSILSGSTIPFALKSGFRRTPGPPPIAARCDARVRPRPGACKRIAADLPVRRWALAGRA